MRKFLITMGYISLNGKVDKHEIVVDILVVLFATAVVGGIVAVS